MKILAVDSSAAVASVAVLDDGRLLYEGTLNNGLTHSEKLLPMIEQGLALCNLTPQEIDVFACSVGPGSFTGVRIGVETVKSLAQAVGVQCAGVCTLDALARNVTAHTAHIVPVMDARCGQVYCAEYDAKYQRIIEPCAIEIGELLQRLAIKENQYIFLGDGVPVYREQIVSILGERACLPAQHLLLQRAASVAIAVAEQPELIIEYSQLLPLYLRKPQAERELDKKHG